MTASTSLTHVDPTAVPHGRSNLRRGLAVAAAAGVLAAVTGQLPASAAGDVSGRATVAVVEVGSVITLQSLDSSVVLSGLPGDTTETLDALTYSVVTNNRAGYTVSVQAEGPDLVSAGQSQDSIPISDLSVRDSTGSYAALSDTAPVTVAASGTRSDEQGDRYSDDYSIAIPFVSSDVYFGTLDYVATAS